MTKQIQLNAIDLLKKLSELSSALQIYQQIVDKLDAGENIPEDYLKSITSTPNPATIRKAIDDITLLRKELYKRLIREVHEKGDINQTWLHSNIKISVDEKLWNAVGEMTKKNNDDLGKALSWVKHSFFAWFEFIKNEDTFVQNCINFNTDAAREACVGYFNYKFPNPSDEKRAELTEALDGIKNFNMIRNHFNLNLEFAVRYSMDLSLPLESTCETITTDGFFKFVTENLSKLANNYQAITKHLIDIYNDIPANYNPGDEALLLLVNIRDVLSLPFQRIGRYGLTFKEIKENALKVTTNNLCNNASDISNLINQACTTVEETVREANKAIGKPPQAIPKERQAQPIQEIINHPVSSPNETMTPAAILDYIKNSMLDNTWEKTGRGTEYTNTVDSKTHRLPRHMSLILKLIDSSNSEDKGEQLKKVAKAARTAAEFRPSCLNFFYKRDIKTQKFYEFLASISPDKTENDPQIA
jgi:hypothetical protein